MVVSLVRTSVDSRALHAIEVQRRVVETLEPLAGKGRAGEFPGQGKRSICPGGPAGCRR